MDKSGTSFFPSSTLNIVAPNDAFVPSSSSSSSVNMNKNRKDRRKTLSYMDLENFLNEVDPTVAVADDNNNINGKLSSNMKGGGSSISSSDTLNNNSSSLKSKNDLNLKASRNKSSTSSPFGKQFQFQFQSPKAKTEVDKVRDFCRIKLGQLSNANVTSNSLTRASSTSEQLKISKDIHETTGYPLLPGRSVYPENYLYAPHTLDSKRALIYSMAENLNESEKQKKLDTALCEDFTRSKVGKSKDQRSSFEYFDLDINVPISEEDYERRYLLFLESVQQPNKGNRNFQSIKFNPPVVQHSHSNMIEEEEIDYSNNNSSNSSSSNGDDSHNSSESSSYAMEGDSSVMNESSGMDNSGMQNTSRYSSKSNNSRSGGGVARVRRGTLSPASMRDLLEKEALLPEDSTTVFDDNLLSFNNQIMQSSYSSDNNSTTVYSDNFSLSSSSSNNNSMQNGNESQSNSNVDLSGYGYDNNSSSNNILVAGGATNNNKVLSSAKSKKPHRDRRQSITLLNPVEILADVEMEDSSSSSSCVSDNVDAFGQQFNINAEFNISNRNSLNDRDSSSYSNSNSNNNCSGGGGGGSGALNLLNLNFNSGSFGSFEDGDSSDRNMFDSTTDSSISTFSILANSSSSSSSPNHKRLKTVRAFEPSGLPLVTLDGFQDRAYARMCVRFETIRWKYNWEIASNHAAIRAREIYNIID